MKIDEGVWKIYSHLLEMKNSYITKDIEGRMQMEIGILENYAKLEMILKQPYEQLILQGLFVALRREVYFFDYNSSETILFQIKQIIES